MACCLMAPSHYLNQYGFLISEVLWHSPEGKLTVSVQATILYNEFENYAFKWFPRLPGDKELNWTVLWPDKP